MLSHLSVILFTGGVSGRHPSKQTPWVDTPTPTNLHKYPLGRHHHHPAQTPPWVDTPPQTPPRQTPWVNTPGQTPDPPPETATAADGTHPTGMHSCYSLLCIGRSTGVSWTCVPLSVQFLSFSCSFRNISGQIKVGSHFSPSFAPFNRPFFCCPLTGPLNGLIRLKPILSVIQPVTIYTILDKNGPL